MIGLRLLSILALTASLEALPDVKAQLAPSLHIDGQGSNVTLTWPGDAVGFRLETTDNLSLPQGWTILASPANPTAGEFHFKSLVTDRVQFFRLFRPAPSAPSLGLATVDKNSILPNETATLHFQYADPDGDYAAVIISSSNWLGVVTARIPAAEAGLTGASGEFNQVLRTGSLAFGANLLCISLEDSGGRQSPQSCVRITLGGNSAGTAPQISTITPESATQLLPQGAGRAVREFTLNWTDPDGDVSRLRGRITRPDGSIQPFEFEATPLGFEGTSGIAIVPLIKFSDSDQPGMNLIEVALVDANGHVGNSVSARVETSLFFGEELLRVDSAVIQHNGDIQDRMLVVSGSGFDAGGPASNSVQLNGENLAVLDATASTLRVALPRDAQPGRVRVANRRGSAWAPEALAGLPIEMRVTPENSLLAVGSSQTFTPFLNNRPLQKAFWSVEGIPGGNADVGTITPQGAFVAPDSAPALRSVTLTAAWIPDTNFFATVKVALAPPPPEVGEGMVTAKKGGGVATEDGRALVTMPAGALSADAAVSVRLLEGPERPLVPQDRRFLAAFDFNIESATATSPGSKQKNPKAAGPISLNVPVSVTVPLAVGVAPGAGGTANIQVSVGGGPFQTMPATVSADGSSLNLQLSSSGRVLIADASGAAIAFPPVIDSLAAGLPLEEGRAVPVRLQGQRLMDDLQAEILTSQDQPTSEVIPGTLHTHDTEAGITLFIKAIRDLPEGSFRNYKLVLRRPNGFLASVPFTVAGHDELNVADQVVYTWTNETTVRFSEINVSPRGRVELGSNNRLEELPGGIRLLRGGVARWECTGFVRIDGTINGRGPNGGDANGSGGHGGATQAGAGTGGNGRENSDPDYVVLTHETSDGYITLPGFDARDNRRFVDLQLSLGKPAIDRTGRGDRAHNGFAGLPGQNVSLFEDIAAILEVAFSIFETLADSIVCATTGTTCAFLIGDAAQTIHGIDRLIEHFNSESGRGSPGQPGEATSLSAEMRGHSGGGGGGGGRYNYYFGTTPGGGGGGGGGGGKGFSLITAGNLFMNNGSIWTTGGSGGAGSPDSDFNPNNGDGAYAPGRFSGGAGGAGSGGDLRIRALGSLGLSRGAGFNTYGGVMGLGGGTFPTREGGQALIAHPDTRPSFPGQLEFRGSPQASSAELVLPRRFYTVTGTGFPSPVTLIVRAEDGSRRQVEVAPGVPTRIALFDGFNRLYDARDEGESDLLQRSILVIPEGLAAGSDDDGDGLGLNDELEAGTDPNNADTDGDGVNDLDELMHCRNPLFAEPAGFANDSDCDGWPDWLEQAAGTDIHDARSKPYLTWIANPQNITVAAPEFHVPPLVLRGGNRPAFIGRQAEAQVARPALFEPGITPNTTMALPPDLKVQP